ncbi:MAG: DUF3224 domain-containing protein [Anaerolineales bacterium]|nr:DUF3224 domain-containing protein [Anaerolineales bacterium]
MSQQAQAKYTVTHWEQTTIEAAGGGPAWARAVVLKSFDGELKGTSRAELLMAGEPATGAGYIAQERFVGRLGDRVGAFDMQPGGAALPGGVTRYQFGYVVPHSGTGGFAGLAGTVLFRHDEAGAVFTLLYTLAGFAAAG